MVSALKHQPDHRRAKSGEVVQKGITKGVDDQITFNRAIKITKNKKSGNLNCHTRN